MPFWKCYYHIVWATKHRAPLIAAPYEQVIVAALRQKAEELRCPVFAINCVEDHIHLAVSIPPSLSVADCVGKLKGASSRAVNVSMNPDARFHWQEGYGVMSFGEKALTDVVAYIQNQKEHHASQNLNSFLERID